MSGNYYGYIQEISHSLLAYIVIGVGLLVNQRLISGYRVRQNMAYNFSSQLQITIYLPTSLFCFVLMFLGFNRTLQLDGSSIILCMSLGFGFLFGGLVQLMMGDIYSKNCALDLHEYCIKEQYGKRCECKCHRSAF